jgi:hypothetical protein
MPVSFILVRRAIKIELARRQSLTLHAKALVFVRKQNNFFSTLRKSVLLVRMKLLRIRILFFIWFRILHEFFSHIFNIRFTFLFPSRKCVRLILWRDISFLLFREIFWIKCNL